MLSPSAEPQREATVTLRDGRVVAYSEWGPGDGRPVVLLHGMPGSRYMCPDVAATESVGIRLVTLDRPGYGSSTPNPGRTLLNWVDDFVEWSDAIGLGACPVLGWSSGGPYALACAHREPERVTTVGLLASVAPVDEIDGEWERETPELRAIGERVRRDPHEARDAVSERVSWFVDGWPALSEPQGSHTDDRLLQHAEVAASVHGWMGEGARQGTAGYVDDWIAQTLPWQFSLAGITRPVDVWWGSDDDLVARSHTDALADRIPGAVLHVLPEAGHLMPITHWREILAAALQRA
jgi:pimeloyl-ACP methyl ester carboxylesterase